MKTNVSGITSLVLVLIAFTSLISMFALTRIDNIVHKDLYNYGLRFSYKWAMPYWTMTTLVFAMGWVNIFIAIVFQFYVLLYGRREAEARPLREALKTGVRYQPPIKEKVEEPKPQERMPAEAAEAETRETIAPQMEVEQLTWKEGEEAQEPVEEYREEPVTVVEEETFVEAPQEYMETEQPEEAGVQREPETSFEVEEREEGEITETVEAESQEPVDVRFQEEPTYAEEEETGQGEMPRETVETETQESSSSASETETETTKREEPRQQEAELSETYPT
jgi:hypothetical protein